MARKPNSVSTVTITISTTKGIQKYLEDLVGDGLLGKNPAEVAERLVARGIESRLQDGLLPRRKSRHGKKTK